MREDIDPKKDNAVDETMLEDILKHLDGELEKGAVRMSVVMDEKSEGKEQQLRQASHRDGGTSGHVHGQECGRTGQTGVNSILGCYGFAGETEIYSETMIWMWYTIY